MEEAAKEILFIGPFSKELQLSRNLLDGALGESAVTDICRRGLLSHGLLWELCHYKRQQSMDVVIQLSAAIDGVRFEAANVKAAAAKICRFKTQRSKLLKDKSGEQKLKELLDQHFDIPVSQQVGNEVNEHANAEPTTSTIDKFERNVQMTLADEGLN